MYHLFEFSFKFAVTDVIWLPPIEVSLNIAVFGVTNIVISFFVVPVKCICCCCCKNGCAEPPTKSVLNDDDCSCLELQHHLILSN